MAAPPEQAGRVTAYVGIGSNLDDPATQVRRARAALDGLSGTSVLSCSGLYRSAPMGPEGQPDYINAVACVGTVLGPHDLLHALKRTEREMGRAPAGVRWGPRLIDLDLLLYGERLIDSADLNVPHPGLSQRAFVLLPLAEIAPQLHIPGVGALQALLDACPPHTLDRLEGCDAASA